MKILLILILLGTVTGCGRTLSQVREAVKQTIDIAIEAYEDLKEDKDIVVDKVKEAWKDEEKQGVSK